MCLLLACLLWCFACAPPLAKALPGDRSHIAQSRPACQRTREGINHATMPERQLPKLDQPLGLLIPLATRKSACHELHRDILGVRTRTQALALLLLMYNAPTQVNEDFRDVNLDRAGVIAGPAERGGIGQ